jgi:hypothetical protein
MRIIDNAQYIATGDPKTDVQTTLYRPSDLGRFYQFGRDLYMRAQLENSTLTVTPAVKLPVYFKDRANSIVTFDIGDSEATVNAVAGFLEVGATVPAAGQYFFVLVNGDARTVAGTNVNFQAGGVIVAAAAGALVSVTASGTAPVSQKLGTVNTAVDRSGGAGDVVIDVAVEDVGG